MVHKTLDKFESNAQGTDSSKQASESYQNHGPEGGVVNIYSIFAQYPQNILLYSTDS